MGHRRTASSRDRRLERHQRPSSANHRAGRQACHAAHASCAHGWHGLYAALVNFSDLADEFDSPNTAVAFTPADSGAIPSILTGDLRAINVPLVNQPDTKWLCAPADVRHADLEDGAQADWVGQFAIRVTGQTLRSLISTWVAAPLGLTDEQFGTFLTPTMLANLVAIHTKSSTWQATNIVMPQYAGVPPPGQQTLASAPVYATMPAFAKFLSTVLAAGPVLNIANSPFAQIVVDDIGKRGLSMPGKPVYLTVCRHGQSSFADAPDQCVRIQRSRSVRLDAGALSRERSS